MHLGILYSEPSFQNIQSNQKLFRHLQHLSHYHSLWVSLGLVILVLDCLTN